MEVYLQKVSYSHFESFHYLLIVKLMSLVTNRLLFVLFLIHLHNQSISIHKHQKTISNNFTSFEFPNHDFKLLD
jgi:hypothetical protein